MSQPVTLPAPKRILFQTNTTEPAPELPLVRVLVRLSIGESTANLVVAVPGNATVAQLLVKVEQAYAMQQMRFALGSADKHKVTCLTISIKEVFEICDHR